MEEYTCYLRIIAFHYSNFRLINTHYDDYDSIFLEEIKQISLRIFSQEYTSLSELKKHKSCIAPSNTDEYLFQLIVSLNKRSIEDIIIDIKTVGYLESYIQKYLLDIYILISETSINDSKDMKNSLLFLKDIDTFLYHLFSSIFTTFRWQKNLLGSLRHINALIDIKPLSTSFYLFRIRNLFLFYYQSVVWVSEFNSLMLSCSLDSVD